MSKSKLRIIDAKEHVMEELVSEFKTTLQQRIDEYIEQLDLNKVQDTLNLIDMIKKSMVYEFGNWQAEEE